MSKDSLEHIIQKKFEGASSSVPSNAWSGIESQLGGAVSTAGAGSVSLLAKVIIGVSVAASIIVAGVLINTSSTGEQTNTAVEKSADEELTKLNSETVTAPKVEEKEESTSIPKQENINVTLHNSSQGSENKESLNEGISEQKVDQKDGTNEDSHSTNESVVSTSEVSVQPDTAVVIHVDKNEQEPVKSVIKPSKIISSKISEEPLILEFKLDRLDENSVVQWFMNDEYLHTGEDFRHEQTFDADITVMALITSDGEETQTLFKDIKVELPMVVTIPNIFSPNGDLLNPVFTINQENSRNVSTYTILVTNTKGELVFESDENQVDWNGDLPNGNQAPEGLYLYIIQAQSALGQTKTEKGTVQIKR